MVSIKLAKPWLEHAIGDTVEVDPLRAQWLRDNGFEAVAILNATSDSATAPPAGWPAADHHLDDVVAPGHMVSPRVRKAIMSKLAEPVPDLEVLSPVADLPVPNQDSDPFKD